MKTANIEYLIKLLDDPDKEIYTVIENELYSRGASVIKPLEDVWGKTDDKLVQERIEIITQNIHFKEASSNIKKSIDKNENLIQSLLWISKYQYPDLDIEAYTEKYNSILNDLKGELTPNLTPLEQIKVVNHIFFDVHKFTRSFTGYNSPQSYFVSNLIESKKGNIISLCLLYLAICQDVGLNMLGLELPDNMVLSFIKQNTVVKEIYNQSDVLFYINPSNKGAVFSKFEIDDFLTKMKIEKIEKYYTPISNFQLIIVSLESLIFSYNRLGYKSKKEEIERLIRVVKRNV